MNPGDRLGKYRLIRRIGDGAMGVVWAAVHEMMDREFALKLLPSPAPELKKRMLQEARACGKLRHPNIVEIYDIGETDRGDPFLVMELLSGETLADRLERARALRSAEAVSIALAVTRALRAAHAKGIVHRDLKPANIFLHREADVDAEQVKVLDFGISKSLSGDDAGSTTTGMLVGSPAYMSPEQAGGEKGLDQRSDLWTVGVLLFEMIAGARPFPAKAPYAAVAQVLGGPIPRLADAVPNVPAGLSRVVEHCLTRDRDARVASADDLLRLLRPFADDLAASHDGIARVSVNPEPARPALLPEGPAASPDMHVVQVAAYPVATAPVAPASDPGDQADSEDERPTAEHQPEPPRPVQVALPAPPIAIEPSARTDVLPDLAALPGGGTLPLNARAAPPLGAADSSGNTTVPLPPMQAIPVREPILTTPEDMRSTAAMPRVAVPVRDGGFAPKPPAQPVATASTSTTPIVQSPQLPAVAPPPAPPRRGLMVGLSAGLAAVLVMGLLVGRCVPRSRSEATSAAPAATEAASASSTPAPASPPSPVDPPVEGPAVAATAAETSQPLPEPSASGSAQPDSDVKTGKAWVKIKCDIPAHVFLDGRPLGLTPLRPVLVAPGPHRIVARHSVYGERAVHVQARNGRAEIVNIELTKRTTP